MFTCKPVAKGIFCLVLISAFYYSAMAQADAFQIKADKLAHKFILTDGHVDLPYRLKVTNFRLEREYLGIPVSTENGDFDYERAKKGGLDAPFMSIYIPSTLSGNRGSCQITGRHADQYD